MEILRSRARRCCLFLGLSVLVASAATRASVQPQQGPVDLLGQANVQIDGAAEGQHAGWSVAGAGDVNGDGKADVLVGAPFSDNNDRVGSGSAYVIFGQQPTTKIDLAAVGNRGFRIDGAAEGDFAGGSVAGAGDMNGDGKADVIVGAEEADSNSREQSGSAYVVFGAKSTTTVDLAALGSRGFQIDGAAAGDSAGFSVAAAGDVTGDGRADVVVGAPRADSTEPDPGQSEEGDPVQPTFLDQSGSAYVIFGQGSTSTVDLATLGSRGFRIDGADQYDRAGWSVAGAGDMNGDGKADVIVGAPFTYNNERLNSGSAYVVFGQASPDTIQLSALGERGFRIDGAAENKGFYGSLLGGAGSSVAGAGDVNADGRGDIIIGAMAAGDNGREASGAAYVVFGKSSIDNVDLAGVNWGFQINGATAFDFTGRSVAGVGDANGDKRADVLVGAEQADGNGRDDSGSAYVVFGQMSRKTIDLAALGSLGLRIDGAAADELSGWSVAGISDVNGDGQSDVLLGAHAADNNEREDSGSAYVVFLRDLHPPTLVLSARSSQRVHSGSRVLVTGSCDEPCTLRASGTIMVTGQATRLLLKPTSERLGVSGRRTIALQFAASVRNRVEHLLGEGKRVQVVVSVRAADSAGNVSTDRKTITLRR